MMKALSKITGQAKALKFAMDLAKNHGIFFGEVSRSGLSFKYTHVGGIKQCKGMVISRDFRYSCVLFGLVM